MRTVRIITLTLQIILFMCVSDAQSTTPNPLRAVVSTDLEEPYEIYEDGGFEAGEHDIRKVSPYTNLPTPLPTVTRTQEAVHSGNWAYKVENSSTDTVQFSVWSNPDKAENISFSCWVKSASGALSLKPRIVYETARLVGGPVYGSEQQVDNTWSLVAFSHSTKQGFRFVHAGIQVPPGATLFIDDVSVKVPVWKEPEQGSVIGGVKVPASPVAPVNICFSIHIEDPSNLISSESFFWKKSTVFEELAKIFHNHGGFLNIQPELEWAEGSEKYAPGLFASLAQNYNVTFSTHTHGPNCKGADGTPYGSAYCKDHPGNNTNITDADVAEYIRIRREKFETLSGISVTDHNGNFDLVNKSLLYPKGVRTLSVFKNKNTQRSYDYLYTNPWRPGNGNALDDISTFVMHNPTGQLIYIPGYGANVTKRHERVQLKVRRFTGQFIKYADADRVNAMNLVLHVDAFEPADPDSDLTYIQVQGTGNPTIIKSAEFLEHLALWDDMLTNTIDPLVAAGYLKWATHAEIAADFITWENAQVGIDNSDFQNHPAEFTLNCYPNPFNGRAVISSQFTVNSKIHMSIYNSVGKRVKSLYGGDIEPGIFQIAWDGTNDLQQQVGSGVYICRLQTEDRISHMKMILMK